MRFHLWNVGLMVGHLLLSATAQSLTAQADSGIRIRVSTNIGLQRRWWGTLVSVDADSLRFIRRDTLVSLPLSSVVGLERSRDRHTNAGGGAVIGALVGAGTGLLIGILASSEDSDSYDVGGGEVLGAMVVLGAVGGGVGALIGAASHRERWEPMPLPGRPAPQGRATVVPRLGLMLGF